MNDKGYKLASDQESMAFWKKVTADYFRYAYDACKEIIEIKQLPSMQASEQRERENQDAHDHRRGDGGGNRTAEQRMLDQRKDDDGERFQTIEDLET